METLKAIASHFNSEDFKLYKQSPEFDIYLYKKDERIELAILRQISKPHYHTQDTGYFLFLDQAIIQLGGRVDEKSGAVASYSAEPGNIYIIAPYILHAAGPRAAKKPVRLLIYNEQSLRERNTSSYPDDTVFPESVEILY